MPQRLAATWIILAVALLAVVGSGTFVVWKFVRHVTVPCSGSLRAVAAKELGANARQYRTADESNLEIRWEEKPNVFYDRKAYAPDRTGYTDVRVVWTPPDAPCACSDVAVPWPSNWHPSTLRIDHDAETGLYVVRDHNRTERTIFRRVDDHGRRLQRDRIVDPHNVSMLIFVLSLGALGLAAGQALRATPYATRMYRWHGATLRHDGLVESDSGAALGMMELRSRVAAGPVIVDPTALEARDVYRGLPILTRRTVGSGSHEKWAQGTMRRLRDARMLAILAALTTTLALVARAVGA